MKGEKNSRYKNKIILNWTGVRLALEDLRYLLLPVRKNNNLRGRFRIKYGMTLFNGRGFTLIELLVVVLIIGILSAVALPQYQKTVEINDASLLFSTMLSIKNSENIYKLEQGAYTDNWEELSFIPSGTIPPNAKTNLVASDGKTYILDPQGTPPHIFGLPRKGAYMIYLAMDRDLKICYPKATVKGKRVCKYLGCAENKLNDYLCYF